MVWETLRTLAHSRDRANRRCSCGWHKGFTVRCFCKREDTTDDDVQSSQCLDQYHTQYKFIIIKHREIHIIALLNPSTVGSTTGVFTATSLQKQERCIVLQCQNVCISEGKFLNHYDLLFCLETRFGSKPRLAWNLLDSSGGIN